MTVSKNRLYGSKQIGLIVISGLTGIGFFLYRRHYETGTLGKPELFGAAIGVIMLMTITVFIVRKGNRGE